jgi:hypothetical protein
MEWIIILVVIVIGIALFLLKAKGVGPQKYPYEQQGVLFTAAERSFYGVLCQAVEGKAVVFGKVRVGDVLKTRKGLNASERQKAFNQISAKHFDYVLCKPDDLSVLAAVELDDKSHNSKKRRARDEFLKGACEAAGLTLHRFKASNSYKITDVRETLFPSSASQVAPTLPEQPVKPQQPEESAKPAQEREPEPLPKKQLCPKCSSELVLRVAKNGKHKGSEFLACSAFPNCRYMVKPTA